jgi:ABC-type Fe3+ transport system substrate-binding protein
MRWFKTASMIVAAVAVAWTQAAAAAADKLVILSPHRKSIQEEFVPLFKDYYQKTFKKGVEVDWLDQGGTSAAVKYLGSKVRANPANAGIDLFWGGTSANFIDMARDGLLAPYELSKAGRAQLPAECAGVPLSDSENRWHATVVSSFGILFNRMLAKLDGVAEPKTWDDLGDPKFRDNILAADPRKSGTNSTMNQIVLQGLGWQKGWSLLARIAGNTRRFTQSSSDPVHGVVSGDAVAAMVIDFYGLAPIWELGEDKLGFVLPAGQTILDPDPIALVRGAPNKAVAARFIEFLYTPEAQRVWLLPKGAPGGPRRENLARLAVSPQAYKDTAGKRLYGINPYEKQTFMRFDLEAAGVMREPLNDLVGAVFVDLHPELKAAWTRVVKDGLKPETVAWLGEPPVSEADLAKAAKKWDDNVFRNQTINGWVAAAKTKYAKIAAGESGKPAH